MLSNQYLREENKELARLIAMLEARIKATKAILKENI